MPDLTGMTMRRAMKILNHSGVRCRTQGTGLAVSQQPAAGEPLVPNTICVVKFEPHL
jgi:beta-lactam-binding protein with PASTA domain